MPRLAARSAGPFAARPTASLVCALAIALGACSDQREPTSPGDDLTREQTVQLVRQLAADHNVGPLPPAPEVRPELVHLGQALAFDKILSGNRDISCMTCHAPTFETGDARSTSIGQGAQGLGPGRQHPDGAFIPRNAPPLFNLASMKHLFWDGRVEVDDEGHVTTPAGAQLTTAMASVFEFGSLSALGMFPVASASEMRGDSGNELAAIPDDSLQAIWAGLMQRLGDIPEYRDMFEAAYPGTRFEDMTFAHASNAIAAFIVDAYTFDDTPWDRFLAGQDDALDATQLAGAKAFLSLKCSSCHNGPAFSDDQFHDVAVAQIGPGEGNGANGHDDFGRMNVSNDPADRYRFRTSPLRNVELTAPYGHDGAITSLRAFVEHYSESDAKLLTYDPSQLESVLRSTLQPTAASILAQRDTLLNGVVLTDSLVDQLTAYMRALTDATARDLSRTIPDRVPSGLPVDRN